VSQESLNLPARTILYGPFIFDPSCDVGCQVRAEHLGNWRVSMTGVLARVGVIDERH
jgi:hypothetical protein